MRSRRVGVRSGEIGSLLRIVALALAAAFAAACKAPPPVLDLPAFAVVAPVNFDLLSNAQLEPGEKQVAALVRAYLARNGVRVQEVEPRAFVEAWRSVAGDVRSSSLSTQRYAELMGMLVEALADAPDDTAIVVPHLLYRNARLAGSAGKWDGVKRPVILEGFSELRADLIPTFSADAKGVSTRVRIYEPKGVLAHDGYGGIDLPWKIVGEWRGTRYYYNLSERTADELFADPALIARSVVIAFDPYIPR